MPIFEHTYLIELSLDNNVCIIQSAFELYPARITQIHDIGQHLAFLNKFDLVSKINGRELIDFLCGSLISNPNECNINEHEQYVGHVISFTSFKFNKKLVQSTFQRLSLNLK